MCAPPRRIRKFCIINCILPYILITLRKPRCPLIHSQWTARLGRVRCGYIAELVDFCGSKQAVQAEQVGWHRCSCQKEVTSWCWPVNTWRFSSFSRFTSPLPAYLTPRFNQLTYQAKQLVNFKATFLPSDTLRCPRYFCCIWISAIRAFLKWRKGHVSYCKMIADGTKIIHVQSSIYLQRCTLLNIVKCQNNALIALARYGDMLEWTHICRKSNMSNSTHFHQIHTKCVSRRRESPIKYEWSWRSRSCGILNW